MLPESVIEPTTAVALAVTVVNLLVGLALWRRLRTVGRESDPRTTSRVRSDGVVDCPSCETTNEAGYRLCRSCLAELPAGDSRHAGTVGRMRDALP